MIEHVNVATTDIIRLVLQFLKECNLMRTFFVLQEEANVKLNASSDHHIIINDIKRGDWKNVLRNITTVDISDDTLFALYEQLICELAEYKENELIAKLMSECVVFKKMKHSSRDTYSKLRQIAFSKVTSKHILYDGIGKEAKRNMLCERINKEIKPCAPSRLISLLGMALKWQNHHGLLNCKNGSFDVFRNVTKESINHIDALPDKVSRKIQFGEDVKVNHCITSKQMDYLISCSTDGFIEIWNWATGSLNTDLEYQAEGKIMMHDHSVTCVCISDDDEVLLSGDSKGIIKIWKIKSGECGKEINAHSKAIINIAFNNDETRILTSSYDNLIRIFGLRSLKCLKEFTKHEGIISHAMYNNNNTKVICAVSGGRIYIYNEKTTECLHNFHVYCKVMEEIVLTNITNMQLISKQGNESILVCLKAPYCYVMDLKGRIMKTYTCEEEAKKYDDFEFVYATISPNYKYTYVIGNNNKLYCFNYASAYLEKTLLLEDTKQNWGIVHHLKKNIMAVWSYEGTLSFVE